MPVNMHTRNRLEQQHVIIENYNKPIEIGVVRTKHAALIVHVGVVFCECEQRH